MKKIEEYVRSIPDFPEEGIIFRDITSVLQDADGLHLAIDSMQALLDGVDLDVVVGAESRGFVIHDVAPGNKLLKFLEKLLHLTRPPVLFIFHRNG